MSTIVTRSGKGSALSFTEMDNNFSNLNTDKLENITSENLTDLSDVVITGTPADNEVLAYDTGTSKFINQTAVEAGLAALTSFSVTTGAGAETSALSYNNSTGVFTFTPNTTADLVALDDLSVGAEASASGDGAIAYNNTTGVFTYTPPTAAGIGAATSAQGTLADSALQNVVEDTTPQLGGDLDVQTSKITTSTSNGNLTLEANGTGSLVINAGVGINLKTAANIFTDATNQDIDISPSGTGLINMNSLTAFGSGIEETVYASTTTTGTYAPDPTNGSIHYVALSGSMTINGFSTAVAGQTITLFFDGTGGAYTLTLGASVLSPGGSLALTSGGYDIVTITCIDDVTPVYVATAVNNFQ